MIDSLSELFNRASSPGDLATLLLAGTAGFLVDAGLNAVGFLSPGAVGITSASAALGVKKSWEASNSRRRTARRLRQALSRAERLYAYLKQNGEDLLALEIQREVDLCREQISSENHLENTIDSVLERLRGKGRLAERKPAPVPEAVD